MAAEPAGTYRGGATVRSTRRFATETKPSMMSTELYVWAATVVGILIAGAIIDSPGDTLTGKFVWLYVAIVSGAYMVSRGLAKSGSHYPTNDEAERRDRD